MRTTRLSHVVAFVPLDYREQGAVDEWSGDAGVGAQYFSQQAVGRLLPAAGIELSDSLMARALRPLERMLAACA